MADGYPLAGLRVRFAQPERTLTDAEVAEARQALIDAVTTTHGATLGLSASADRGVAADGRSG